MEKKKVNLKEILQDINSGMHRTQIMVKHELSPAQLAKVMEKLETMSSVQRGAQSTLPSKPHSPDMSFGACPNCRAVIPIGSGDCPKCGIVLSRYQDTPAPSESAEHRIRTAASRAVALSPAPEPRPDYAGKIVTGLIIAAMVLVPYGIYRWFRSGLETARIESHAALVQSILKEVNQGRPDYFGQAKKLVNATGNEVVAATKEDAKPSAMRDLGRIYSSLLTLGGLQSQLEQKEEAQGRHYAPVRKAASSGTSDRENRIQKLQTDLFGVEEALSRAQDVAAQAEAASRMQAERMAYDKGGRIVSHRNIRTEVGGVTVEQLEQKRQDLVDKINSESAKMTEAEQPGAPEISPAVEDDSRATIDGLREQLDSAQQQLVSLCREYLKMAGKSPAETTEQ